MEPRILKKEAFMVAGVSGSGDETAKAWESFMKLEKANPLKNKVGEEGYEIRMYLHEEGPGEVHVGVPVTDARVPAEYKIVSVPAFTYAEFEIYPSKGYGSSNAEMNKWLLDNGSLYKEGRLSERPFAIEVYDKRYKGDKDPASVVGILVPLVPVARQEQ
jgi:predicted transcriptional regulator YdeE